MRMGCKSEEPDIIKVLREEEKHGKLDNKSLKILENQNINNFDELSIAFKEHLDLIELIEEIAVKIHDINNEKELFNVIRNEISYTKNFSASVLLLTEDKSKLKIVFTAEEPDKLRKLEKITGNKTYNYKISYKNSNILQSIINDGETHFVKLIDVICEIFPKSIAKIIMSILSYEGTMDVLTPLYRNDKIYGALAITSSGLREYCIPSVKNLARHISLSLDRIDEKEKSNKINFDLKKSKELIEESGKYFRNLFNSIADPIAIVDSKGKFLEINDGVTKITDYTRDDLINKNFLTTKIVTKKSKIKLLTNLTKRMAGIDIKPYIVNVLTKEGNKLPYEVNAQKIQFFGKPADIVIFRDISERIKAEESLKTSEIRYRTLFETSDDGIFIADLHDNIKFVDCNPKSLKMFCCKLGEIIGKTPMDFSPEYQSEGVLSKDLAYKKINNLMKGSPTESFEWIHKKLNGEEFFAEINLAIIELEGKKYLQGIVRDVTDKKKAEISIRESEEKYRALFYNNVDLLFMHGINEDKPSNFIEVNDKFCKTMEYSKEELLKTSLWDLSDNKLLDYNDQITKFKSGGDVLFETIMNSKSGKKIPLEIHNSMIKINGKNIVLGIARDITERKIAEEELEKLASVVRHSGELVNLATLDGKMIFLNEAGEKMLGIHQNQVKNHVIYDVIPKDYQFVVKKQVVPSILNKGFWDGELKYKNIETGDETNVYALTFLIEDPETKKPLYLANVSRDITEQKRDERKLEKAHEELKELNEKLEDKVKNRTKQIQDLLKQKDQFINQLGHDLKNPLGPLVNLLPIVEKEEKDPKLKEILQVINRNVEYMRTLVIKTIQLARLNSSKAEFKYENTNLLMIIESVIKNNELLFKTNRIDIKTNISKNININIDRLRFEELLNNLLNNSVKYSKELGRITIDSINNEQFVTMSIKDNGIGMTDEQINHMFDEFYKADESRHDFDSSGLGLSISKKIVEKHGGKLWAESEGLGKGSTFYFTLPLTPQENYDKLIEIKK
jgi:PAS domain S-box-containing protein